MSQTEAADRKWKKYISCWILKLSTPEDKTCTLSGYVAAARNPQKFPPFLSGSKVDYVRLM